MPEEIVRKYTLNGVSVIWRPALCKHGGRCARELPAVFDPRRRPWIQLQHADSATVTAQVERCPTGALAWIPDEPGE